jgi:hypothetical protein
MAEIPDGAYVGDRLAECEASSSNTIHGPNTMPSISSAQISQPSTTDVECSIEQDPKPSTSASPGLGPVLFFPGKKVGIRCFLKNKGANFLHCFFNFRSNLHQNGAIRINFSFVFWNLVDFCERWGNFEK